MAKLMRQRRSPAVRLSRASARKVHDDRGPVAITPAADSINGGRKRLIDGLDTHALAPSGAFDRPVVRNRELASERGGQNNPPPPCVHGPRACTRAVQR